MDKKMKLLGALISIATRLLPKRNWVIIQTFPIWEENGVVLYQHLLRSNINKIIWLVPELPGTANIPFPFEENKTIFIKRKSVKGIMYYMLSKYVFITHGLYNRNFPSNQISVNLWHGVPIKKIGLKNEGEALKTSYNLSTSTFFNPILAESFDIPVESVLTLGLPRNEHLLKPQKNILSRLGVLKGQKVIMWLPTYRQSAVGEIRLDGTDYNNAFNLPVFNEEQFNEFLKNNNMICFLKRHPMAPVTAEKSFSNFKIIDDDYLYERNLLLYQVLSVTDILVSDVSSIIIDFLLTEKPLVLSFSDQESYINSRGINCPEVYERPPGKICQDQEGIMEELYNLKNDKDRFIENRKFLKDLYHEETDAENCTSNLLNTLQLN